MGAALPVLYSFRRCPYAIRARLALAVSGQPVELREVVLRDKPLALIDASPKATVPVLVLSEGAVLDESLDIMLWALRRNDPLGWLTPGLESPESMLALIALFDQQFKPQLDRYKYPGRYPAPTQNPRDAGVGYLEQLESRLAAHSCLFGHRASLADMAIAPFVRQFAQTDRTWFDARPWPGLSAWLAAFEDSALYAQVMQKFVPWVPGALPTRF